MHKEPDNQSSGKAIAKIASKTAAAASIIRRGKAILLLGQRSRGSGVDLSDLMLGYKEIRV